MKSIFTPQNPNFEEVLRESFSRQGLMSKLGAELHLVEPGEVHIAVPFTPDLTQQHGFLHAGVTASIADTAAGYAAYTLVPPGYEVLTVEFKINLLSPATGDLFLARGRVIRPGRRITACMAEVSARNGEHEEIIATMLSTIAVKLL